MDTIFEYNILQFKINKRFKILQCTEMKRRLLPPNKSRPASSVFIWRPAGLDILPGIVDVKKDYYYFYKL